MIQHCRSFRRNNGEYDGIKFGYALTTIAIYDGNSRHNYELARGASVQDLENRIDQMP